MSKDRLTVAARERYDSIVQDAIEAAQERVAERARLVFEAVTTEEGQLEQNLESMKARLAKLRESRSSKRDRILARDGKKLRGVARKARLKLWTPAAKRADVDKALQQLDDVAS